MALSPRSHKTNHITHEPQSFQPIDREEVGALGKAESVDDRHELSGVIQHTENCVPQAV